ASLCLR
ncbi:flavin oxidoreductase / NADH oxidase family protein, partial [Vibrio parahaemolyticus V-223/04]